MVAIHTDFVIARFYGFLRGILHRIVIARGVSLVAIHKNAKIVPTLSLREFNLLNSWQSILYCKIARFYGIVGIFKGFYVLKIFLLDSMVCCYLRLYGLLHCVRNDDKKVVWYGWGIN